MTTPRGRHQALLIVLSCWLAGMSMGMLIVFCLTPLNWPLWTSVGLMVVALGLICLAPTSPPPATTHQPTVTDPGDRL